MAKKVPSDPVPLEKAVEILKDFGGSTKFDESIEIHMRLGVDDKQADQIVRGSIVLPHGIGKTQRVIVFAKGGSADIASEAGADEVGQEDLAKKIKEGWLAFDVCIAAPDMMGGTSGKSSRASRTDAVASCGNSHPRCGYCRQGIQSGQG